jgi:hypothetical protein
MHSGAGPGEVLGARESLVWRILGLQKINIHDTEEGECGSVPLYAELSLIKPGSAVLAARVTLWLRQLGWPQQQTQNNPSLF